MDGASSEGRSEYEMQSAGGRAFWLLSRGAFTAAGASGVISLLLVYRLWVLSTSRLPEGFPGGWLLSLTDLVVGPFRDYEHSAATAKQTGFVDFPALIALEVCLVFILVFAVFGYLFHLLQPHQRAVLSARQPRRPLRIGPVLREAAAVSRRGISAAVIAVQRQDWAGYHADLAARGNEVMAWLAAIWRAYYAGCRRDADWLRERWQQACASAGPTFSSSGRQRRAALLRARRSFRRTRIAAVRLTMRASASIAMATTRATMAFSDLSAGARRSLERGSSWYWSNFDATSNRVAAAASKLARGDETFPVETPELASEDAEGEQLSRREFLRRLRPLR